jgi:hypothetical protein
MEPATKSRRHVMRRLTVQMGLMKVTVGMNLADASKLNPFPALTLQSARDLNVPCNHKQSKALLLTKKTGFSLKKKMYLHFEQKHLTLCRSD